MGEGGHGGSRGDLLKGEGEASLRDFRSTSGRVSARNRTAAASLRPNL
jgi:hypothetical protein